MSRLSTHLPQLASLALAVIAAAVSYSVHADRTASSRAGEARSHAAGPTTASHKARSGSASSGRKARRRGAKRGVRPAEGPGKGGRASRLSEPQAPPVRPVVVTVAAPPPHAPSPPAPPPPARRPHHVDRLRAEPGVERGVDPAFQPVTGDANPDP